MLLDFALTPQLFDADTLVREPSMAADLERVLLSILDTGTLADLQKSEWSRVVAASLETLPHSGRRRRLMELLSRLKDCHRLVAHPRDNVPDRSAETGWLQLIGRSHDVVPFDAVLATEFGARSKAGRRVGAQDIEAMLDSSILSAPERQYEVVLREDECRQLLRRFLAYARDLHIVDPYMACGDAAKRRFLEVCLRMLRDRRGQPAPARLTIHSGHVCRQGSRTGRDECANRGDPDACLAAWTERLGHLAVGTTKHIVEVKLWRANEPSAFHDRFLITDQAGLMSGNSFEVRGPSTARRTTWSLMGERRRADVLLGMSQDAELTLLGEREIRVGGSRSPV